VSFFVRDFVCVILCVCVCVRAQSEICVAVCSALVQNKVSSDHSGSRGLLPPGRNFSPISKGHYILFQSIVGCLLPKDK
jgi:hypothetical protein